jgi:tRNA pseudouridine32 synthase / 23S rRNA pseudouridine746 synthase
MFLPHEIEVLFSDEALLVVNKPAGLATLPDGYNPTLPHIKSVLEREFGALWVVHRLDKYTSGVLVLARSASAHRSLNTQFEQRQVSKVYHTLVNGSPEWLEKTVSLPLRSNGDRQHRTVVDPKGGKPAVTHFTVLERLGEYCLLQAVPETGRTHQIRAHLYALDLYIIGDKLYTRRSDPHRSDKFHQSGPSIGLGMSMALHAATLELTHPLTGQRLKIIAPYPVELTTLLEQLHSSSMAERPLV